MKLERWLSIPVIRSNRVIITTTIFGMLCTVALVVSEPHPALLARKVASTMAAFHSVQHLLTLLALQVMIWFRAPFSAEALAAYCNPRRISHLDVAAAWIGFYVLVPYGVEA